MEPAEIFAEINNTIQKLKQLNPPIIGNGEEKASEVQKKETPLISKIVNRIHEILSDHYKEKSPNFLEESKNKNYYWDFISKHFNTPEVRFCQMLETNNFFVLKGKNWIYFSLMEKSLLESIKEIYIQELDKIYYEENAIIRQYQKEIEEVLKELEQIHFINIIKKDYENFLDFKKKIKGKHHKEFLKEEEVENYLKMVQSPIMHKRVLSKPSNDNVNNFQLIMCDSGDMSSIFFQSDFFNPEDDEKNLLSNGFLPIIIEHPKTDEDNEKKFNLEKKGDFSPSIIDKFYTFLSEKEEKRADEPKNEEEKNYNYSNEILNEINEEENNSSNHKEEKHKIKVGGLVLNPKKSKHLPTDKFYEINEKKYPNEYNKNDKLIYKKKKRPISNCLLLYLNKFYQKAPYYKFYKHNINNRPISLKDQNYQCYICLRKIPYFLNIPFESIFWCSYYMRFVCKNCINKELSIIPHFVLKKWCFDKCSISKRAKNTLELWYNKPIIILNKNDKLLDKIPQLIKVIKVKKVINDIFDSMKCDNKFEFIDRVLGDHDYLALKEYIFSLKDLVEINNKTFFKEIIEYKEKCIQHISGECPDCKYEGERCYQCGDEKKIFFYNIDEVFYCKICKKSFHKKCIGFVGHVH
jgi:hypothetical protein